MSKVQSYIITNKIKLIRRVIDHGYDKAFGYANVGDDEDYTKTLQNKTKEELLAVIKELKDSLYTPETSNRKKSPYEPKFCIGKCQREFIPKDSNLEIYCASCDRVIAVRPIKQDFKDI